MTADDKTTEQPKKEQAVAEQPKKSTDTKTVTLKRGDETTKVAKPSAEYSRLVFGYGWKEA